ncbi:MAG: carbon-nitrogen hydrolase family protein [Gemmatimonadota bacterium]|nr:carbon-nitrogen hydrolase family protein [Gemmatimonadota bacterium]MDH5759626.1 carbon-nitrogen hydrolase family protein [Gemmatimonadota bacterium]
MSEKSSVRVAVVQAAPVPFDTPSNVDRVCALTAEAAGKGAEMVLFPEAYVGGYPWGLAFGTAVGGRSDAGRRAWERYWSSSVAVPGPEVERMAAAAADAGVHLCVGVVERDSTYSGGTLFCTLLYFGPDGSLLGKHRKLKPTAAERLIWGEGDGSTLPVVDTPFGKMGGLICWENYMPLARMAMYGKGVEIYLAPTADARDRWQSTLQHIALEGRCFVLGCNQYVTRDMYPEDLEIKDELLSWPETLCRGGSAVYGPLGDVVAGPLWDEAGMLVADLDLTAIPRSKFDFDVTGHYARPDVFRLEVDERPHPPVERR